MSEQTPSSQAEDGEQNIAACDEPEMSGRGDVPGATPAQTEGEDVEHEERSKEWEAGRVGP